MIPAQENFIRNWLDLGFLPDFREPIMPSTGNNKMPKFLYVYGVGVPRPEADIQYLRPLSQSILFFVSFYCNGLQLLFSKISLTELEVQLFS